MKPAVLHTLRRIISTRWQVFSGSAIHNLHTNTFGAPWLIATIALFGVFVLGVILAQFLLLLLLLLFSFGPVTLPIRIFPGRGLDFFRTWLGKLAGYLARKVLCSLILAVTLAVSQALADTTSNLRWLLAFVLQARFLWMVFIQCERLTSNLAANERPAYRDRRHPGRARR